MQHSATFISNNSEPRSHTLPLDYEHFVIGDLHGCIDELKQLLIQNGFTIDADGLIHPTSTTQKSTITLLGDFIDKASEEKLVETLEFIHKNYYHLNRFDQRFYLIVGNHEEMVYRYITRDPTLKRTPENLEKKEKYYNTAGVLERNNPLRLKFLELYKAAFVWLHYAYTDHFSVTLTHAPCPEKHLRKSDRESEKKMVKCASRSKNRGVTLDDLLPYIHQEAQENEHYHIFGHLSQPNIRRYKNKICIDTSSIYGDNLSCAIIRKSTLSFDSTPFQHKQLPSKQTYNLLFNFS